MILDFKRSSLSLSLCSLNIILLLRNPERTNAGSRYTAIRQKRRRPPNYHQHAAASPEHCLRHRNLLHPSLHARRQYTSGSTTFVKGRKFGDFAALGEEDAGGFGGGV